MSDVGASMPCVSVYTLCKGLVQCHHRGTHSDHSFMCSYRWDPCLFPKGFRNHTPRCSGCPCTLFLQGEGLAYQISCDDLFKRFKAPAIPRSASRSHRHSEHGREASCVPLQTRFFALAGTMGCPFGSQMSLNTSSLTSMPCLLGMCRRINMQTLALTSPWKTRSTVEWNTAMAGAETLT